MSPDFSGKQRKSNKECLSKNHKQIFGGYLVQIVFIEETNSSRMLFNVQLYKDNLLFWKMILMTIGAFNTIALLIKKKKKKKKDDDPNEMHDKFRPLNKQIMW